MRTQESILGTDVQSSVTLGSGSRVRGRNHKRTRRPSLVIISAILRAASRNGGESITMLKQKANLSSETISRYVKYLLERGLLVAVELSDEASSFHRLFRPTELGYDFLLKQKELMNLISDSDYDPQVFNFWD